LIATRFSLPLSDWFFVFTLFFVESCQGPHEKRLLNHLLSTYNTLERPVANESEPLEVKFGLTLQQIIDVVSGRRGSAILLARLTFSKASKQITQKNCE